MSNETAQQEFERLRTEMDLGRPLYMMPRESAENKPDDWYAFRNHGREKFMAMIDARERMEGKQAGSAGAGGHDAGPAMPSIRLAPEWRRSNEKLLSERVIEGGHYGQL